jgi:hypothetical protein
LTSLKSRAFCLQRIIRLRSPDVERVIFFSSFSLSSLSSRQLQRSLEGRRTTSGVSKSGYSILLCPSQPPSPVVRAREGDYHGAVTLRKISLYSFASASVARCFPVSREEEESQLAEEKEERKRGNAPSSRRTSRRRSRLFRPRTVGDHESCSILLGLLFVERESTGEWRT